MKRRDFVRSGFAAAAVLTLAPRRVLAAAEGVGGNASSRMPAMTVYKTPSCGCCKSWVSIVKGAGFDTRVVDLEDLSEIKRNAGVPAELQSCHTALIGAYVVEGHVPPDLIKKILAEKPAFTGLAVGGMPVGAPGMEQGNSKQPYNVMSFTRNGKPSVYARR